MNRAVLSLLTFVLSSVSLFFIFNEIIIFRSMVYFLSGLTLGVYYFLNRRTHSTNRKADKLMILALGFFFVSMVSSYVYAEWNLSNMLTIPTVTKMSVALLSLLVLYLNFVYIRLEHNYKRKRGNQRIRKEPEVGYFEQLTSTFKERKQEQEEITLILGSVAENEDV